jgi:hypothetical protein
LIVTVAGKAGIYPVSSSSITPSADCLYQNIVQNAQWRNIGGSMVMSKIIRLSTGLQTIICTKCGYPFKPLNATLDWYQGHCREPPLL